MRRRLTVSHNAPRSQHPNRNVFSSRLNCSMLMCRERSASLPRAATVTNYRCRLNEAGSWEFSQLFYRCNRMMFDMLNAVGPLLRPLSLPKRHIHFKVIARNVSPRPPDVADDRRRLQKLPIFLHSSAPESEILKELKDTVCIYTVGHEKRATLFCTITPMFLDSMGLSSF